MRQLFLFLTALLALTACNNSSDSRQTDTPKTGSMSTTTVPPSADSNSTLQPPKGNYAKHFKIDSSKFEIWAWTESWWVLLENDANFESQLIKTKALLKKISKEMDITQLRYIEFLSSNKELLADIASIKEIQENLRQSKEENKHVNSIGVLSDNMHKSKLLKQYTDLFSEYRLEPIRYQIEKCQYIQNKIDTTTYTMGCGHIGIDMKAKD